MIKAITKTIQEVTRLLNRDVRDLFKAQGLFVGNEFLGKLRKTLHETGIGQDPTEYLVAEVGSAWHGRIVQKDQVLAVLKMRLREALG